MGGFCMAELGCVGAEESRNCSAEGQSPVYVLSPLATVAISCCETIDIISQFNIDLHRSPSV